MRLGVCHHAIRHKMGHMVLRDVASGAFQLLPLFRKTDAVPAFKDWVESMRKNPLYQNMPYPVVSVVQTDNEGT